MRVSSDMPDDVIVLHDALQQLREYRKSPITNDQSPVILHLKNCGTALRFLQVHLEKCYPGEPITLTGDARLLERKGKPTSQTISARILHGENIPYSPDESPYITMTRRVMENYQSPITNHQSPIEADWSSASYWYEYVAIHGGELLLEGLMNDSIQGDRVVADIYAEHFGVTTKFVPEGALIKHSTLNIQPSVEIDFTNFPDLYPAIALTCERLGIKLLASGTDRLRFKESDRLEAVRLHEVRNDHRIAMALIAADYIDLHALISAGDGNQEKQKSLQTIIAKSYPQFCEQYARISQESRRSADGQPTVKYNVITPTIQHITPIKGVNDDNLGKKHALSKLIHAATSEYVWLHDDDIVLPPAATNHQFEICNHKFDLLILPLKMESEQSKPSLLEKLQIAEYAAIQELTMRTAKKEQAVMCSGANLIVRREAWLACERELHPEIPSGDDMFLLEAMKRHGYKIGVIDEQDYTAVVRPLTTWREFFRQRMRWAGKAPKYTDKDIRRCGAVILAANILQLLCPLIILIKFPIEYSLIRSREITNHQSQITNIEPQTSWLVALLLELVYPIYMLVAFFGGLLRRNRW